MTLEQIKNRQNEINESLYQLVQSNTQLIDTIVGQEPESPKDGKGESPNGLIEEVQILQNRTEAFIGILRQNNGRLYDKTYSPVEDMECAKVSY